jgi:hypothetical protein
MRSRCCIGAAAVLVFLCPPAAFAQDVRPWPDSFMGRLEVFALIEQLNGDLLAGRSATVTLEAWCAAHRMANPARLTAILDRGENNPATVGDRLALEVSPDEPIRHRHVRLACGTHFLSEAENWYVPSRLTPSMNHQLETTDTPFGRAVQDLHPVRQTLSVERLWSPLPEGWDRSQLSSVDPSANKGVLAIPLYLFRHRALLFDLQHHPIALVVESYSGEALRFPR